MCNCNKPQPCGCVIKQMGCKDKDISTDCIVYTGDNLSCSLITKDTILTDVIKQLDEFICEKFNQGSNLLILDNIGSGAEIYKGDTPQGHKQLRSIVAGSSDVTITEDENTITIDVAAKGSDIYTQSASFNSTSGVATFNRNNSTSYTLDLTGLSQVQANITETNTASKAYIQNKNPTKTIPAANYTVGVADNNYVVEVNNSSTNITITIPAGLPNNFFVGFIQKGTGTVTFTGYDIKPIDYAPTIYGQGHNAALEVIGGTRYIFGNLADA